MTEWLHWRAALLVCTLYGCAVLALVVLRLPETLRQRNPHALQPKVLMHTWALVTRSPTFLAYSLLTCATYGGLFTFLAASPFVFIEVLGLSRAEFGLALFSISMFYLTGTTVLPLHARPRHSSALRAGGRGVALSTGRRCGIRDERFHDDGCGLCRRLLAWQRAGWQHLAAGAWRPGVGCGDCHHRLDLGAALRRTPGGALSATQ